MLGHCSFGHDGRDTPSEDGTIITDVQWSPGKVSEKKTYLYGER